MAFLVKIPQAIVSAISLLFSANFFETPYMFSIFKIESYHYWILSSLHEEIIENPCSLWFQGKELLFVIFHAHRQTEAITEQSRANKKA